MSDTSQDFRKFELPVQQLAVPELPKPELTRLDNDLSGLFLHNSKAELVKLMLMLPGGKNDYEFPLSIGAATLLKEGSKAMPGEAIADLFDRNGAEGGVVPLPHHTILYVKGLRRNIHEVLPVFFDYVADPTYPAIPLEALQRNVLTEWQCEITTPNYHATQMTLQGIWGKNSANARQLDPAFVMEIDSKCLLDVHRSHFFKPEAIVSVAGNIDDQLTDLINRGLSRLSFDRASSPICNSLPHPVEPGLSTTEVPDTLQHAISIWMPAPAPDASDYWMYRVAVHALGGYFGSRLMQNIREDKGYTYGIGATVLTWQHYQAMVVKANCDPDYTAKVVEEIRHELTAMAQNPLSDAELSRLKLNIMSNRALRLDTIFNLQAEYLNALARPYLGDSYNNFVKAAAEATPESIAAVALKYFKPEQMRINVAGPKYDSPTL